MALGLKDYLYFIVVLVVRIIIDLITVVSAPILYFLYNKAVKPSKKVKYDSVFITGGSSGIGRQLAYEFALRNNSCNIIITGRNQDRLNETEKYINSIKTFSGNIVAKKINVTDATDMEKFIKDIDEKYEIDLMIANAGIGSGIASGNVKSFSNTVRSLIDVNITGVINTILPVIPLFQDRKHGHIAITGSLAAWVSKPNSSYAATKAYVRFLCDDLRPKLKIWNINVSYIGPGYVDSRMCPKGLNYNKPFFLSTDEAVKIIVHGLENNNHSINFPSPMFCAAWLVGSLHPILQRLIYDGLQNKNEALLQIGTSQKARN